MMLNLKQIVGIALRIKGIIHLIKKWTWLCQWDMRIAKIHPEKILYPKKISCNVASSPEIWFKYWNMIVFRIKMGVYYYEMILQSIWDYFQLECDSIRLKIYLTMDENLHLWLNISMYELLKCLCACNLRYVGID